MNKIAFKHLKWKLLAILSPNCWSRSEPCNQTWDHWLRDALHSNAPIENLGRLTVTIKGLEIWVANIPDADGGRWEKGRNETCSRATALLLRSRVKAAGERQLQKELDAKDEILKAILAAADATT